MGDSLSYRNNLLLLTMTFRLLYCCLYQTMRSIVYVLLFVALRYQMAFNDNNNNNT